MARSHNRIILIGNLGKDAELRATPGGTSVATTTIAINDPAKKDDTGKPGTEWYRLKVWGRTAENLGKYLLKGKQVYVEGRLSIQTWKDREGKDRYTPEVSVDQILLLGSPGGSTGGGSYGRSEPSATEDFGEAGGHEDPAADDIPF
jgi:single-strand DNA-binding protein